MNVLVVEADPTIRNRVQQSLQDEGFTIMTARSRAEALAVARVSPPNLVLIGGVRWDTPTRDLCALPSVRGRVAVVSLASPAHRRATSPDTASPSLADAHGSATVSARDLARCVRALLAGTTPRRSDDAVLRLGALTLDLAARAVHIGGTVVPMRAKEFGLLVALAQHVGETLHRDQLLEMAWGYDVAGVTRTVDVHVQHVRRKLRGSGVRIETERGVGYRLELENAPSHPPAALAPTARAHVPARTPSRNAVSSAK